MKNKRNTSHLPEDMLVEILSRVSVASLARLRSTSKRWNNLIKDVILPKKSLSILLVDSRVCLMSVDLHGTYNNDVDNVVNLTSQFSLKDRESKEEEVDIREVFHYDGLLLCVTKQNSLVLWNPCSGKSNWIKQNSNDKIKLVYYALGKSSGGCNEYKILKVNQHGRHGYEMYPFVVEYEVYDLSSNTWRNVGETREWSIPKTLNYGRSGTSVNGNTYWIAFSQESLKDILLCFDFSTERFVVLSLPDDHVPDCYRALSVTGDHQNQEQQQQQLWIIAIEAYKVNVWVETEINSASTPSWRNFKSMEPADFMQCFTFGNVMNFLVDRDEKVLVCCSEEGLFKVFLDLFEEEDKFIKMDHNYPRSRGSRHLISFALPTST